MGRGKDVKAGGAYAELGVRDHLEKGLKAAEANLRSFGAKAMKIGAGVGAAGAAIAGPLLAAAKVFSDTSAPLDDLSKRLGVGGSKLSELQFAAEQSGASLETVEGGLKKLAKNLHGADEEGAKAVDTLGDLGLSVDELRGLSPDQQFNKIADAIAGIEDPSKKTALAMEIFGSSGADLIPMLENGSAGLAEMAEEGKKLGVVLSDDAIKSGAELDDTFGAFWSTIKGVTVQIGAAVAGPLTMFLKTISGIIGTVSKWIEQNAWLVQVVGAVGVALVAAGAAIAAVGIAATALASGISVIGAVIGALLSPIGLVAVAVAGVVVALATLTDVFDPIINYLSEGFTWLSNIVGETIDGISAALSTGDIAAAAQIAFTSLKLIVSKILESVLGIFGLSIADMSNMLGELYKQIGQVLSKLNEARAETSNWIAQRIGDLVGVEVTEGDSSDLAAARAWSAEWAKIDPVAISQGIQDALDPNALKAELDALVAGAKQGADEERKKLEAEKRKGFEGVTPTTALAEAGKNVPKSFGGFSVADLNRRIAGPKDFQKATAENTKKSVDQLILIARILPTIGPKFI